jgi:hypothetical protein
MTVEQRLLEHQKKYHENMESKKQERLLEEMSEMRECPIINAKSVSILHNSATGLRVEDRLLSIGKMWT